MSKAGSQTPLMRQYNQIKAQYPNTVLLFRLGDFFETFEDDAVITAKVCGITLTKRNNGAASEMPLAGFPHHQLDNYLPKLVRAGYRVAVCEQLEDPKMARGIVKRGVIEVVTPGIALYDKLLDAKKNNFVAAISAPESSSANFVGFSFADVSTGEFYTCEITISHLKDLLESISPQEIIINKSNNVLLSPILDKLTEKPAITKLENWLFELSFAQDLLNKQFNTLNLKGFGIEAYTQGISAAAAIVHYISETQKAHLPHIRSIKIYNPSQYMFLDYSTRRNLEITFSMNDNSKDGTLFSILDYTITSAGSRMLKRWISQPLCNINAINDRLSAVESLHLDFGLRASIRKALEPISDLERLISKICTQRANPRDTLSLKQSLEPIPHLKNLLFDSKNDYLINIANQFEELNELVEKIKLAIREDASTALGSGNIFNTGYDENLDTYVEAKYSGKNWIAKYQEDERNTSGISTLKVGFNNVFGYYIEISNVHKTKVPTYYERRQTLSNAERYTTSELKEIESKILSAEDEISLLETKLFNELKAYISNFIDSIQLNANLYSTVDCIQSFSECAAKNNYVKANIEESEKLEIVKGRHPVVEKLLPQGVSFTANDTYLDTADAQVHIITGPNMSGKSCYLRQTALIVLLAQIGSYVPAESATVGICDRIFTRVGASDNLAAGESTFLVEMQEAANIVNNATSKSLLLLDEVGRGTATFDGIAIAWAISEHIHDNIGAKTLFATHYHELNELAQRMSRVKNYRVEVIETGNNILFTHKVVEGASDHSFGIHVAKMSGLPLSLVDRANEIMRNLESMSSQTSIDDSIIEVKKPNINSIAPKSKQNDNPQMAIFTFEDDKLRRRLKELKIEHLTPLEAFTILSELIKEAR